jgi:nucleotide-binding universal stress UspA family protein
MKPQSLADPSPTAPSKETELYKHILVALDSSDHANAGVDIAIALAGLTADAQITGVHAYAAKLHDVRFRQMEGGLPEQFREEQELERQRDVHDDLISKGLSIITDSYLDQAERDCQQADITFKRRSPEGKNYRALTEETNSGHYDLLVMGALGLGAVEGSRLGTVCQRVARRSDIDTLVIKQPERTLAEGPIVVAVDGSAMAYGGLITALQLAKHWQVSVKVIAVFDPYFHYVAFNRIAGVLSEEAGKVFRFQEQERLHEEIIDSGLAKIYQGHLDVAQSIAMEHDVKVDTLLLDGKPHDAITKYIKGINPSLLVIGKLGIHADDELDIGGNAENLLQNVDCAVLLSQRQHQPRLDVVADVTTSWTHEAERAMDKVPGFARNMARMAILRYAQDRGHTVITASIVEDATSQLCPSHAKQAMAEIVAAHDAGELNTGQEQTKGFEKLDWSTHAEALLNQTEDSSIRNNLRKRAEKKARTEGSTQVEKKHLESFIAPSTLDTNNNDKVANPNSTIHSPSPLAPGYSLHWQAAALARLMRVPEGFMRDSSRQHIENYAQQQDITEITLEVAEAGLQQSRQTMETAMKNRDLAADTQSKTDSVKCPFAAPNEQVAPAGNNTGDISWSSEASERLGKIPAGMSRDMTCKAAEAIAHNQGISHIERSFLEKVLDTFQSGSLNITEALPWEPTARLSIQRAPDMVRGMLIKEIENWAMRKGLERVTETAAQTVKTEWQQKGYFHLAPDDPRSGNE